MPGDEITKGRGTKIKTPIIIEIFSEFASKRGRLRRLVPVEGAT